MNHTPGPWRLVACNPDSEVRFLDGDDYNGRPVSYVEDVGIVDGDSVQLNHPQGLRYLAHIPHGDEQEGLANARLIAAAPDLLAALRELYELAVIADQEATARGRGRCNGGNTGRESCGDPCCPICNARRAIAKTEAR